jgi:hypothetical protein
MGSLGARAIVPNRRLPLAVFKCLERKNTNCRGRMVEPDQEHDVALKCAGVDSGIDPKAGGCSAWCDCGRHPRLSVTASKPPH